MSKSLKETFEKLTTREDKMTDDTYKTLVAKS